MQAFAVFAMLAILSIIILFHELGHFSVARLFGFQTPIFGFGLPFGPHWVVGKKWGTEFRIHACLLGGYVAIPELGDESNADAFGALTAPFRKFPIWQRALVAFAGVGFNILLAYIVMLTMYLTVGESVQPTVVASLVKSNPIATNAGIKEDDQIATINGRKVTSPDEAVHLLVSHKLEAVHIGVIRGNQSLDIVAVTNKDGKVGMALIPSGTPHFYKVEGNFFQIAAAAGVRLWNLTISMLDVLGQMVTGIFSGGGGDAAGHHGFGLQDLHGVLAVIKIGADVAQQDWNQLFFFTIFINLDLAIINLVPWPALDGWHLATLLLEAVRGKPMQEKAHGEIVKWGFISLIALMVVVMFNDITALISGKLDIKRNKTTSQRTLVKPNEQNQIQTQPQSQTQLPNPAATATGK
jgi:regulator of sigma E protease